ncbi:serine protease [Bacillus timonensis]|nr:serine protease [Bacillus timonensis]
MKDYESHDETKDYEEPSLEDFLPNDEDYSSHHNKSKKILTRIIVFLLVIGLLSSVLGVWVRVFNLTSIDFLQRSSRLSQEEKIQEYKESVVTIQDAYRKGTGFNIHPNGIIVTNHHVIEEMRNITVSFLSGQLYKATVLEDFPNIDIAILEIDGEELPFLPLQLEDIPSLGEEIYVIGNPLIYSRIAIDGEIVEITNRTMKITGPIEKGNSGSPVINEEGSVIGVVYAKTIPSVGTGEASNGLAVPISSIPRLNSYVK